MKDKPNNVRISCKYMAKTYEVKAPGEGLGLPLGCTKNIPISDYEEYSVTSKQACKLIRALSRKK
ncbi:MAG: hypothetical protein ABSA71_10610 [Desulfomonilia bacterium]|jgi:hypothetical protein